MSIVFYKFRYNNFFFTRSTTKWSTLVLGNWKKLYRYNPAVWDQEDSISINFAIPTQEMTLFHFIKNEYNNKVIQSNVN